MWKTKKLLLFIDLTFCLIIFPAMIALLPIERWLVRNAIFVYLLIPWLYIIYILNRYVTMPFLFAGKKRFWMGVLLMLVTVIVTFCIMQYQIGSPLQPIQRPGMIQHIPKIKLQKQAVWFLYMIVTTFSIAVGLLTELYRQITQRQLVEFEKKKAELALYKAQINPHFLFNSLNTLYGMVITHSSKAEDAFVQFISLMKYMYTYKAKETIPVRTEIEYIQQYIELQKYRISENFHIHFSYSHDETEHLGIAPMLLITFVENVFKHGVSSHKEGEAYITITVKNGELLLSTINPLLNQSATNQSKGIGIENCRKRLELLYPRKYALSAGGKDGLYNVTLSICLK